LKLVDEDWMQSLIQVAPKTIAAGKRLPKLKKRQFVGSDFLENPPLPFFKQPRLVNASVHSSSTFARNQGNEFQA